VPIGAVFLAEEVTMIRFTDKLRFVLATCLALFAVGAAKAALPDITRPVLDPKIVNEVAVEPGSGMGN